VYGTFTIEIEKNLNSTGFLIEIENNFSKDPMAFMKEPVITIQWL